MGILHYIVDEVLSSVTAFGTPVFYGFVLIVVTRFDSAIAIRLFGGLLVVELIGAGIKLLFPIERPLARHRPGLLGRYDGASFPSIHSARAAFLAISASLVWPDPLIIVLTILLAIGVGTSRVHLRHHRWIDVCAGFALGAAVGFAQFTL